MLRMAIIVIALYAAVDLQAAPTDIGGIVNTYASVRSISTCRNRLQVDDASGFRPGDTVVLIQMQGARVDDTGAVTSYGTCGQFERNVIDAIAGDAVVLRHRMLVGYDAQASLQLVRMPSYASARVATTLTCAPWNGRTGGVLAITVRDTVWLEADVDASGLGFRGGDARGEGIAIQGPTDSTRAMANGGGMGVRFRMSGAGGAHHGCGGDGMSRLPTSAGGYAVPYDAGVNWLMMGGAGGATLGDDAVRCRGGNGGGIIIIDAPVMIGNDNAVVRSNGLDGEGRFDHDGAGGGAGGAILITARAVRRIPSLDVRGGDGGLGYDDNRFGGAGGGGGTIRLGTITALNLNPSSYAGGQGRHRAGPYHGGPGCDGRVYYNITVNDARSPFAPDLIAVSADTQVCKGASVGLWADRRVRWTDGAMVLCDTCDTLRVTPQRTTTYRAVADFGDGCRDSVDVTVRVVEAPPLRLVDPPPVCVGMPTTITAPAGYAAYRWNTSDTARSIIVRQAGAYELIATDSNGCTTLGTVTVRHSTDTGATLSMGQNALRDIMSGERRCADVIIANITDTTLRIATAWFDGNEVFGVPQEQLPVDVPPRAQRTLRVCAASDLPGDHVDTLRCVAGCGVISLPLATRVLETPSWSRCRVLVLGAGERAEFLPLDVQVEAGLVVVDVQGRVVLQRSTMADVERLDLAPGVYVVRAVTPTHAIDRVVTVP